MLFRSRDAQQVGDPVSLGPSAQDIVQLILETAERHIQQEKQPGREEIDEAEPKSGPVCVMESQREIIIDIIPSLPL